VKLGELIDLLAELPLDAEVVMDDDAAPTRFASWRGSYVELTLDSEHDVARPTVARLLAEARKADCATFEGYKGGSYTMTRSTPVWADPYGTYGSRAIVGVTMRGGVAVIGTLDISDYR
jgi:hypothetical protein